MMLETKSGSGDDAGGLAAGPGHAALELSLLLTTLQSLSVTPSQAEGGHAPQSTLSTNCHAAMLQLRDWLNQLQHQAVPLPEPVSFLCTLPQSQMCIRHDTAGLPCGEGPTICVCMPVI